ncbi:MAG TPA: GIY-YIG nuclease family protein [Sphingomicrobium sp.]
MRMERPTLTFNELLERSGFHLDDVLVFRHRPGEAKLNRVFDFIVSERPDLFDCYQSSHGPRTEAALSKAKFLASFIRFGSGLALFAGLYRVNGGKFLTVEEHRSNPLHQQLIELGMTGDIASIDREHVIAFDLPEIGWGSDWKGRLVVRWPRPDRSWYRWAAKNIFEIEAITLASQFVREVPAWNEITPTIAELRVMPPRWLDALRHWRGVYLIADQSDRRQYVGSAGGQENLLQRWLDYARSGHGGNKHLRGRDPANFRFAILQRLSPDDDQQTVVAAESSWKERLQTRWPNGLNEN